METLDIQSTVGRTFVIATRQVRMKFVIILMTMPMTIIPLIVAAE
jgi:hypothetical protein